MNTHSLNRFHALGQRQIALDEGIRMLDQARVDLAHHAATADAWALVDVMAQVTLMPLNVIINACELGAAKSLYDVLARHIYAEFARSGTRAEGRVKTALKALKDGAVDLLKKKGASAYVPGVNVLVGLAEDTLALWQSITRRETGLAEVRQLTIRLQRQIDAAQRELVQIGVLRAQLLSQMQMRMRTA